MKTLLKTIQTLAILITMSSFAFSQVVVNNLNPSDTNSGEIDIEEGETVSSEKKEFVRSFYLEHTQAAQTQVKQYLSQNMTYPESMRNFGIEGTVVVEVFLDKEGQITESKIIRSLYKEFDKAVLRSMNGMKKVKVREKNYVGAHHFLIPLHFNLD